MNEKCYYDVLEVEISATQEDIQNSFRKLVKKWHPDVCKHPNAEDKIKKINEAYTVLRDEKQRESYNYKMGYHLEREKNKNDFSYTYDYKSSSFKKKNEKSKTGKTHSRTLSEKETIYRWVKKYLVATQLKVNSCEFPEVDQLIISDEDDKIVIEGFFYSMNLVKNMVKTEYKIYLKQDYKLIKIDFKNNQQAYYQYQDKKANRNTNQEYSDAFKKFKEKQTSKKIRKTYILNFDIFLKNKYFLIVTFVIFTVLFLGTYFKNDRFNYVKPPKKLSYSEYENPFDREPSKEDVYMKKTINILKEKMDDENPITRKFYVTLASQSEGSYNIGQIASIYSYLYHNWKYVNDPQGRDYFAKASESIESGLAGDCDDFAILIATCIRGIGGRTRIVFAERDNVAHAYCEVQIANNKEEANRLLEDLRTYVNNRENTIIGEIFYKVDNQGKYWLNLDWNGNYPGTKYFYGKKEYIFDFGDLSYKLAQESI